MKSSLFIFLLGLQLQVLAQFPTDMPYQSINGTAPALPALNAFVTDQSVPDPVKITRITDFNAVWNWYPHHEYAKIQPWNADGSIYKFYSVAIYDGQTHQMIRELLGGHIYPSYWSNTDPDIIYGFRENGDIKTYSVSNDLVSLRGHIYADINNQTDFEVVKLGPGEGNIDKNDHYVALIAKQAADMYVIIYDLQQYQEVFRQVFSGAWGSGGTGAPQYVDWVSVSQSGNYVGIMWNHNNTSQTNPFNGHYGVEIYHTTDMQFLRRLTSYGNHGDFGYAADGDEVFVQFWGPDGTINMYYLDRMERVVISNHNDFNGEGHISCRNLNRPGWAYVSQDEAARSGQIVAVKLDNSGLVEHFGHHFSTAASYLKSPMPCPNPDGNKIMFKSDFGDTNSDVIYVFEASLENANTIQSNAAPTCQVYPNPAKTFVYIHHLIDIDEIHLFNLQGQHIKTFNTGGKVFKKLDISDLKSGMYLISTGNGKPQWLSVQ